MTPKANNISIAYTKQVGICLQNIVSDDTTPSEDKTAISGKAKRGTAT